MDGEFQPAEIPESITISTADAFDILEDLEMIADRADSENDISTWTTCERLARVIRRALGAEE